MNVNCVFKDNEHLFQQIQEYRIRDLRTMAALAKMRKLAQDDKQHIQRLVATEKMLQQQLEETRKREMYLQYQNDTTLRHLLDELKRSHLHNICMDPTMDNPMSDASLCKS